MGPTFKGPEADIITGRKSNAFSMLGALALTLAVGSIAGTVIDAFDGPPAEAWQK
jgi:hypothetical protein